MADVLKRRAQRVSKDATFKQNEGVRKGEKESEQANERDNDSKRLHEKEANSPC